MVCRTYPNFLSTNLHSRWVLNLSNHDTQEQSYLMVCMSFKERDPPKQPRLHPSPLLPLLPLLAAAGAGRRENPARPRRWGLLLRRPEDGGAGRFLLGAARRGHGARWHGLVAVAVGR